MEEMMKPNEQEIKSMQKHLQALKSENDYLKKDNEVMECKLREYEIEIHRLRNLLSGINTITKGY